MTLVPSSIGFSAHPLNSPLLYLPRARLSLLHQPIYFSLNRLLSHRLNFWVKSDLWVKAQHDRRIEKIEKRLDEHDKEDDQRFEKHIERIGTFEKEFSAEVREALAKMYDRYVELKDWCREKFSK